MASAKKETGSWKGAPEDLYCQKCCEGLLSDLPTLGVAKGQRDGWGRKRGGYITQPLWRISINVNFLFTQTVLTR